MRVVSWRWPNDGTGIRGGFDGFECIILARQWLACCTRYRAIGISDVKRFFNNTMLASTDTAMTSETGGKTCGQAPSCDLVLDHPGVAAVHARLGVGADGLITLEDSGSENGTFLHRNDQWIRVRKVTLCVGDRIRFATQEVPLEQLTGVFGQQDKLRLESRHFSLKHGGDGVRSYAGKGIHEPLLQKPRRNLATGKLEEDNPR